MGFCWKVWQRKAGVYAVLSESRLISIAMFVFLIYTYLVNGFYALKYNSVAPVIYSFYFTLSFVVAISFSASTIGKQKIGETVYFGIAVSLIVQGGLALFNLDASCNRLTLLFNNPNQLAFYSMLCLSFLIYLYPNTRRSFWLFFAASLSSLLLIYLSLSMAAFLSVALLSILQIFFGIKRVKQGIALAFLVLSISVLLAMSNGGDFNKLDCKRFESSIIERKHTKAIINTDVVTAANSAIPELTCSGMVCKVQKFLIFRGYKRIWEHPEYLIFGAGEGVDRAFTIHRGEQKEIHSALGTLAFSYGVIGICFLIYVFIALVSRRGASVFIFLMPLLVYSMFHNTLRQPFLWLFVVLLIYLPVGSKQQVENEGHGAIPPGESSR